MTTSEFLIKRALELGSPVSAPAQGPGVSFHPAVHGTSQGAIEDSFKRGIIQPGMLEKAMPMVSTISGAATALGQVGSMFGGGKQEEQPHPAGTAPAGHPAPVTKPPVMKSPARPMMPRRV